MTRGDLITVAGSGYASKPRPALVVQDDRFADVDSIIVCLLTTTKIDAPLLRVLIEPDDTTGILSDSWVMVDKIFAIKRSRIGQRIGRVHTGQLVTVERRLVTLLGLVH